MRNIGKCYLLQNCGNSKLAGITQFTQRQHVVGSRERSFEATSLACQIRRFVEIKLCRNSRLLIPPYLPCDVSNQFEIVADLCLSLRYFLWELSTICHPLTALTRVCSQRGACQVWPLRVKYSRGDVGNQPTFIRLANNAMLDTARNCSIFIKS